MSQHEFNIANQTASATRVDLNDALGALASLSSGTAAPITTFANMLWYETDTNWLWVRNEADSAWVRFAYFNQSTNQSAFVDDTQIVNTSGTQIGLLGDQTTATWQVGTGTTQSLVSPANVKSAVTAQTTTLLNVSGSAPLYACRAWVSFSGTGTVSILASGNVSSVTDNGTGLYTVNFTNAMPDANYSTTMAGQRNNTFGTFESGFFGLQNVASPQTTTSVKVATGTGNTQGRLDWEKINVAIFR